MGMALQLGGHVVGKRRIIIIKIGRNCNAERDSDLYPINTIKTPGSTIPTYRYREKKGKTVEDKKGANILGHQKNIRNPLETRQSHTIEYRVI